MIDLMSTVPAPRPMPVPRPTYYGITTAPEGSRDPDALWADDAGPILFATFEDAAEAASLGRQMCRVVRIELSIKETR